MSAVCKSSGNEPGALHAWRARVTPADTVYILGDLFAYRYDPDLVRRLTGNLILICGNHEEQHWLSHADLPAGVDICFRAAGKYMPAALDELIIYNDRLQNNISFCIIQKAV